MNNLLNWILETLDFRQPADRPDPSDPCNAAECVDAKSRLKGERSTFPVPAKVIEALVMQQLHVVEAITAGLLVQEWLGYKAIRSKNKGANFASCQ
jgi:hypothetical protein